MTMTAALSPTVVGVFHDRKQAEEAAAELARAGFRDDQVGLAARGASAPETQGPPEESKAAEGGVAGALTGGVLGGALGAVAAGLIPGVGPLLAVGTLAAIGGGAAAGAVAGGAVGALVGMGIPEEEARAYEAELAEGRTLLTVRAEGRRDEAVRILRAHGALGKGSPLV
jgi:hypothetical protein